MYNGDIMVQKLWMTVFGHYFFRKEIFSQNSIRP